MRRLAVSFVKDGNLLRPEAYQHQCLETSRVQGTGRAYALMSPLGADRLVFLKVTGFAGFAKALKYSQV